MGSARLPGKALRPLNGRPMVLHVLQRAAAMGFDTWLATTDQDEDNMLVDVAVRASIPVYRGSARDVLGRIRRTAYASGADVVVRVTGDCPCFIPTVGQDVVKLFEKNSKAIVTNDTSSSGWPDGLDCEVFSYEILAKADDELPVPNFDGDSPDQKRQWRDREHVTTWMRRELSHKIMKCADDFKKVKLSVDQIEDFERVSRVMGKVDVGSMEWAPLRAAILDELGQGER